MVSQLSGTLLQDQGSKMGCLLAVVIIAEFPP